jgi:hypothetical protein
MLFIYHSIFINPTLSSLFYVCLQIAAAIVCACDTKLHCREQTTVR